MPSHVLCSLFNYIVCFLQLYFKDAFKILDTNSLSCVVDRYCIVFVST